MFKMSTPQITEDSIQDHPSLTVKDSNLSSINNSIYCNSPNESNSLLRHQLRAALDKICVLNKLLSDADIKESLYLKTIELSQKEIDSLNRTVEVYDGLFEAIKISVFEAPLHVADKVAPLQIISKNGISIFNSQYNKNKEVVNSASSSNLTSDMEESIPFLKL